jgi:hypothetical protein
MSNSRNKNQSHDKRSGATALSEFAEYVEEQQNIRYPAAPRGPTTSNTADTEEHHEELDELFDNLDLGDASPRVPLKQLLLGTDDESLKKLEEAVAERLGMYVPCRA